MSNSLSDSAARASYHPKGYGVSEGLARARRPFRTRNAVTGSLIALFAFSVYTYSIRAVKQDDFSDLALPPATAREGVRTIEEEKAEAARQKDQLRSDFLAQGSNEGVEAVKRKTEVAAVAASKANWFEVLRGSFAGRGTDSQLVQGAPSVDSIGKLSSEPIAYPAKRIV